MRMRAAVLEEFGEPLRVQELEPADPKAGEVLVRLVACGRSPSYLPDGTARLSRDGEPIRHFMGTSTFAESTVMPEIALAKVTPARPTPGSPVTTSSSGCSTRPAGSGRTTRSRRPATAASS
jgi:Zn-dependent alcohol dehydrogenase